VLTQATAEITFNQDAVLWLGGPFVLSLGVLITGLLVRTHSRRAGVLIGVGGLVLSAAWIAFAFYVDDVLGDT
jgi:hypothetical protein